MIDITGVYSNQQMKKALENGHIVCYPLVESHINGSSFDVTLGQHYFRVTESRIGAFVYNPWDETQVKKHFQYHKAETHADVVERLGIEPLANIPLDCPVIHLEPGERILGHTHEFIGIKAPGTSSMQARSTTGRNGISVCLDAGWGDPGYVNRWTMEIYNMHKEKHIILPVGTRIAQIVFYHTGAVDGEYSNISGKYQTTSSDDLDALVASWHPRQMLPRAYKDTITTYEPLACDDINVIVRPEGYGKYIVIEGQDGTGKSGQQKLLIDHLAKKGIKAVAVPEPGGTEIGADLRKIIKNGALDRDGITNLLLFTADRRELWNQKIAPILARGTWIVADRSWYSTLAYQGYGEGVDTKLIEETTKSFVNSSYAKPDHAFILALNDEKERLKRVKASEELVIDTFEQKDGDFQDRVTNAYLSVADQTNATVITFTGKENPQTIHEKIWKLIKPLLG